MVGSVQDDWCHGQLPEHSSSIHCCDQFSFFFTLDTYSCDNSGGELVWFCIDIYQIHDVTVMTSLPHHYNNAFVWQMIL